MTDFNIWTFNARVFPGIDVLPVRLGDACAIRIANLTMTNHPIHLHGHHFAVELHRRRLGAGDRAMAGDDNRRAGGHDPRHRVRRRRAGRLGVPLPQVAPHDERDGPRRDEFHRRAASTDLAGAIAARRPAPWRWAREAWPTWAQMSMPLPPNTLPMMTGTGPVRADRDGRHVHRDEGARGPGARRLRDPGWYKHPARNGRP